MKLSVLFKRIQHAVIQMPELEEEMEIRGITCNSQPLKRGFSMLELQHLTLTVPAEAGQMDMII